MNFKAALIRFIIVSSLFTFIRKRLTERKRFISFSDNDVRMIDGRKDRFSRNIDRQVSTVLEYTASIIVSMRVPLVDSRLYGRETLQTFTSTIN